MQTNLERRFPRIVTQLGEVWGNGPAALDYLDHLLFKEASRVERQGFTDEIWMDLMFLNDLLKTEHPARTAGLGTDVWAEAADAATS